MPTRDPEVGATGQVEMIVGEQDLASALNHITGDTYPGVFATTRAIALCELAAGRVLAPLLSEGELSVGVVVEVKHTAATPTGARSAARGDRFPCPGLLGFPCAPRAAAEGVKVAVLRSVHD